VGNEIFFWKSSMVQTSVNSTPRVASAIERLWLIPEAARRCPRRKLEMRLWAPMLKLVLDAATCATQALLLSRLANGLALSLVNLTGRTMGLSMVYDTLNARLYTVSSFARVKRKLCHDPPQYAVDIPFHHVELAIS